MTTAFYHHFFTGASGGLAGAMRNSLETISETFFCSTREGYDGCWVFQWWRTFIFNKRRGGRLLTMLTFIWALRSSKARVQKTPHPLLRSEKWLTAQDHPALPCFPLSLANNSEETISSLPADSHKTNGQLLCLPASMKREAPFLFLKHSSLTSIFLIVMAWIQSFT